MVGKGTSALPRASRLATRGSPCNIRVAFSLFSAACAFSQLVLLHLLASTLLVGPASLCIVCATGRWIKLAPIHAQYRPRTRHA